MDTNSPPPFRALVTKAVEELGSQSALAERMGRSQQQVSALCTRATTISAEDALAIHRATGGKVSASDLRPDLWVEPDAIPPSPVLTAEPERAAS
jgi:DNA-binding transcriptional regulator YdaS (Cro superfamily)